MLDLWQEIMSTIKANKLRTFFTGFAVAWGIFMLIILLASGNGLSNGVTSNFASESKNAIYLWPGTTSMAYGGYQSGKRMKMNEKDIFLSEKQLPYVDTIAYKFYPSENASFSNGNRTGTYPLLGVTTNYASLEGIEVLPGMGRFINLMDIREERKVVAINEKIKDVLFPNENPVGKFVNVNNVMYKIIGVVKYSTGNDSREGYIPISTAKAIYNFGEKGYDGIIISASSLKTADENEEYNTTIRKGFASLHTFNPEDRSALGIWNNSQNYIQTMGIFNAISLFIWIVGIGTLIAGIVGVSNIMLITVKERTKEFGIRKALGATPGSIIKLILIESVLITSTFGYFGMLFGIAITEAISFVIDQQPSESGNVIFKNPTVDVGIILSALGILIIAGLIAGYVPAKRAVSVKPIEALRAE
ncbi:ABC transporter permease [Alistipes sp. ZOR0009]|uniref:ABC transporter permease n=1 Tax=Alistipes sp. ZOR0009 TaxID=1339253 RepID=UPI00064777E4|nr:ABC transporter permease [Alistipes sp. ZOR0009]